MRLRACGACHFPWELPQSSRICTCKKNLGIPHNLHGGRGKFANFAYAKCTAISWSLELLIHRDAWIMLDASIDSVLLPG